MRPPILGLLGLALVLSACAQSGHTHDAPGSAKSSPSSSAAPAPPPIMMGTQRYVSPCRVLTPTELQQIYGDPGKYAYFTQEYPDHSIPVAQMQGVGQTIGGSVHTQCMYAFDDSAKTSVSVTLDQYPSPRAALSEWKNVRHLGTGIDSKQLANQPDWAWLRQLAKENEASMGGVAVKGLDPTILYVAGKKNFVGVRRNLVITVSREARSSNILEPKQLKDTVRTTQDVFARIYQNVDDPELEQSVAPPWWEQESGWPTFVDPCAAFDDTTMTTVTGHASYKAESTSVARDPDTRVARNQLPADKAVHNECSRSAMLKRPRGLSDFWSGDLEIAYGAPGDDPGALLDGNVVRTLTIFKPELRNKITVDVLIKAKLLREVQVPGADKAYAFENKFGGNSFGWIMAGAGRYVVKFDAGKSKRNTLGSVQMSEPARLAAVGQILANIKKQAKQAEETDD